MCIRDRIKAEFICVKPKSTVAKDRFLSDMRQLHSCRVNKRSDGLTFVESISGKYSFCLNEHSDDHWEVIK